MYKRVIFWVVIALLNSPAAFAEGLMTMKLVNPVNFNFLKASEPYAVVYFGYIGCGDICPVSLAKLGAAYERYQQQSGVPNVHLAFVDIKGEATQALVEQYVQVFSLAITGYQLGDDAFIDAVRDLPINYAKLKDNPDMIEHTNFFYLAKQVSGEWRVSYAFTTEIALSITEMLDTQRKEQ